LQLPDDGSRMNETCWSGPYTFNWFLTISDFIYLSALVGQ
jgi:hypothetical protein